jgi:hypothetical protein
MSMSSDSSVAQPDARESLGSEVVEPVWLTCSKQPVPHAGRPQAER